MALLKIFKPKWEHHDAKVRLDAVRQLEDSEQDLMAQIVSRDPNSEIQQEALLKLSDIALLEDLFTTTEDASLKKYISNRLSSVYTAKILAENELDEKMEYVEKISVENLLAEIAINSPETAIRVKAVEKISDQALLLQVLSGHCGKEPGLAALNKISDINLLEKAAVQANSRFVRASAQDKLTKLRGPDQVQLQKIRNKEIQNCLREAEKLAQLPDPEAAHEKFATVCEKWRQLDILSTTPQAQQFQKSSDTIEKRLANFSRHKELEHQRKVNFDTQFSGLIDIFNDLAELTDQSDISFPESLDEVTERWNRTIANFSEPHLLCEEFLHDYNCLKKANLKKSKKISLERDIISKLQNRLDQITACFQKEDHAKIADLLDQCLNLYSPDHFQYLSVDLIAEDIADAQARFNEIKRVQDEAREQLHRSNLEKRQALLDEIFELTNSKDIPKAAKRVPEIQEIWAEKLDLPPEFGAIDTSFKEAVAKFQEVCENFYKENDWQLWTNKNLKEEIISEMKALNNVQDLHLVFKEMKKIQEKWNKTGDVPAKEANRLWARFTKASDVNFKRCQKFFTELDAVAEENIQKKLFLIKQAEEHKESTEWNKNADFLKNLQKQWTEIGRVWKEKEDEIYSQFREPCNYFFKRRTEHYKKLSDQRLENLAEKEKFCLEVEEMLLEPNPEYALKIQEIQTEWKKVGSTPKGQDEKMWERFRLACNKYYEWLDSLKPGNLALKEALCQKAEELTETLGPQYENLEKISRGLISFQKEWQTIGPGPKAQNNEVWKKFRKVCDTFFTKRKKYYDELDRQRPGNEEKKKEYIKQVQVLTAGNDKKNVKTIIRMQEEWKNIGPATKKNDGVLDKQFKESCDSFFKERRDSFEELDNIRRENLKKREELCLRLELLAGISQEKGPRSNTNNALTLAEQLKLAFESNFVLAGEEKNSKKRKKDELVQIQKEWDGVSGEVPREHEYAIQKRYKRALKACQEPERTNTGKAGSAS